ncbi:hypothetical protein HRG_001240 [Hirsutella rhossiliensis]|uniref:IQ calmodulin-binding domain-containing protein n=1 Tax=Hirsutella rhossiliensis TaxID=111463 RepID=A0A9P8SMH7_9HYPO|nr:IQ calmodulin-binding domain-containing protein [Hirsutella rhossiliensis]KAH0968598.1 IQ calmodulin-binding domain-containing protein [Hirsutella rhossiliensis]
MDSLVPPDKDHFERIAHVQAQKESQARRRARQQRKSISHTTSSEQRRSDDHERAEAAQMIQKTFRGYRARREMEGFGLDAGTRWVAAIREAQFRQSTKPRAAARSPNLATADHELSSAAATTSLDDPIDRRPASARRNWKKASLVARRAGHDDADDAASSSSDSDSANSGRHAAKTPEQRAEARRKRELANAERRQAARMMGLQYFLEMVDVKHRYGSNLRMYHEEWKKSDTTDNFFYWLDYGAGRNIELDTCPRERLEREQVRYLSREERQYYLVKVDAQGRLCWAKNDARIDTTEQFKDSVHGIVPEGDPTPAFSPVAPSAAAPNDAHSRKDSTSSSSLSQSSAESRREADRAAKYGDPGYDGAHGVQKITHISASTIFNKLLRKSVRKNTWIFVADTSFRLYVGIKDSGAFQHSSFLQGSRISAAGLIKIKDGRLSSLSPLSGHYRPPASNFRAFVRSLKDAGVDMGHVSISKSYTVLVGLETYTKTRRKGKDFVDKLIRRRDKMLSPEQVRRREEEQRDKSESAEKERRFLEKKRLEAEAEAAAARAESSPGAKVVDKFKSIPAHVRGHGGDDDGGGGLGRGAAGGAVAGS